MLGSALSWSLVTSVGVGAGVMLMLGGEFVASVGTVSVATVVTNPAATGAIPVASGFPATSPAAAPLRPSMGTTPVVPNSAAGKPATSSPPPPPPDS